MYDEVTYRRCRRDAFPSVWNLYIFALALLSRFNGRLAGIKMCLKTEPSSFTALVNEWGCDITQKQWLTERDNLKVLDFKRVWCAIGWWPNYISRPPKSVQPSSPPSSPLGHALASETRTNNDSGY